MSTCTLYKGYFSTSASLKCLGKYFHEMPLIALRLISNCQASLKLCYELIDQNYMCKIKENYVFII